MTQREAPDLASAMYPRLPKADVAKTPLQLRQERLAAERAAGDRESLLRLLRIANGNANQSQQRRT